MIFGFGLSLYAWLLINSMYIARVLVAFTFTLTLADMLSSISNKSCDSSPRACISLLIDQRGLHQLPVHIAGGRMVDSIHIRRYVRPMSSKTKIHRTAI
jgi:hypothetical protein